jgi:LacI family transcriptional regulator
MITMRDIAVRAGVSRSTVSCILNDKHAKIGLNEETRRRVLQVADEMGYRRNQLARGVATGKMPIFSFLVYGPMLDFEVASRVLNGVLDEAEAHRYTVQIMRLSGYNDEDVIQRCIELRPAGVLGIYVAPEVLAHLRVEMARFQIPVAVLDSTPPLAGASRILSDDIAGCRQAITHLAELGHKRIAFIGGSLESVASHLREEGYRNSMREHGLPIPPDYVQVGDWNSETVAACTRRLFEDQPVAPTALFCADDKTAMAACRMLRELGRRVPDDVSIVGFADLGMAVYNDPPLTTVAQPFQQMGRRAVLRLLAASEEKSAAGVKDDETASDAYYEERLPTQLIVRQSTAPVSRNG